MKESKKEMKDLVKSIDKMHKQDPEFNTSLSRRIKKRAEKILFHIERGTDARLIQGMVNGLEKMR